MERYNLSLHRRGPIPPPRVSSLNSSQTPTLSSAGRSSEASSMRSGRSGLSMDSGHRTSQESTKPRLSKDQQEFLERQFAHQQKPNTQAKKGFATEMNVPLEKINNWFQNRRAKSKQDQKKKNNAYQHLVPPHPFAMRHPTDQSFIDHSFYQATQLNPGYLSYQPVLPGHSTVEPFVNTSNAHFGVPLEPADLTPSHSMGEQMMAMNDDPNPRAFDMFFGLDDCNDPHAVNMYGRQFPGPVAGNGLMDTIPEYDIPNQPLHGHHSSQSTGDASLRQYRPGAEEASYAISYPPGHSDLPMPPSADFFHPNDDQDDGYALRTWGHSAGQPLLDSEARYLGLDATIAAADAQLAYRSIDNGHYSSGVTPASLHHRPARALTHSLSVDNLGLRDSEDPMRGILSDDLLGDGTSPSSSNDTAFRRESTVSRIVESIDNVEAQPHLLERKASQQSIGHPSLASRRQRRPAPLGVVANRNGSFNAGNAASTKPVAPPTSERDLRRVRSSIGVMNGRVQKSSFTGSAQRSPLSFTFSEAASSSKVAKSLSSRSMTSLSVDTLSRTNSLVPITPVSPPDEEEDSIKESIGDKGISEMHEPSFSTDDSVWAEMPHTSNTTTESVWSSHVPDSATTEYFDNYASPPETPLQHQHAVGNHYPPQAGLFAMRPSAQNYGSDWQQSFQVPAASQGYSAPLPPAMTGCHPGLVGNSSLLSQSQRFMDEQERAAEFTSDINLSAGASTDTMNAADGEQFADSLRSYTPRNDQASKDAGGERNQQSPRHKRSQSGIRSQHTPTSMSSPPQQHLPSSGQYVFQVGAADATNGESGQSHSTLPQSTTTPPRASQSQELMIQQFSPREPVDPSRMPPKHKLNETPKQFEFQTYGPESFSDP